MEITHGGWQLFTVFWQNQYQHQQFCQTQQLITISRKLGTQYVPCLRAVNTVRSVYRPLVVDGRRQVGKGMNERHPATRRQ